MTSYVKFNYIFRHWCSLPRIDTPPPFRVSPVGILSPRPDAAAEKPGSQPHAGGTCAVLKALKFTLELLKTKTEKMTGRI